ncbi:MAG: tetratricopeptide repeat protein [Acidobacteriia bacterium]|nr:tetratricopeptide repeat protein [Terriglobia bacterium]
MGENVERDAEKNGTQPDQCAPDLIQKALDRILASPVFRSAHAQQAFLRYAVGETLAGRGHQLKEYIIGIEAFGRGSEFDPRLDPIVRTQATKLRARLAKYYESEGAAESVRIEFRKGSYAPFFRITATQESTPAADHGAPGAPVEIVDSAPSRVVSPKLKRRQTWRRTAVAMLLTAIALAGSGSAAFYASRSGFWERLLRPDAPSVAVLPFANIGHYAEDEFLSDGLAEEVSASLRRFPGLQVTASGSAFRFKNQPFDIRKIGRQLHVRTVLVGSIQRSPDNVRIAVQLNSADGGYHLWSGNYERAADNTQSLPSEIAGAVSAALGVGGLPRTQAARFDHRVNRDPAIPNPAAYQDYLKGLHFWNKLTFAGLQAAIRYLEQAIAEDPSFARAYAALADCYVMAPQVATAPPPEVVSKIKSAASRALELDSTLGEPHFDLAVCAEYEFDWVAAESEFKKGLELSPGNAVGHLWYAKYLAIVGRKEEVLLHRRIAASLDPVSPYAVQAVAGYFSVIGQYDDAIRQFGSALELDPGFGLAHQGLGIAYLLKGMPVQAIAELETADRLMTGPRRKALLGYAYGVAGNRAEAERILKEFLADSSQASFPALAIAQVYIGLADKDHAFEWLRKAIDQRDLDVTLKWDSPYDSLRSDARFTVLLQRMKLA